MDTPVKREVVVPGDILDGDGLKPGAGTFSDEGHIYASLLGIRNEQSGYVNVIPLGGRYIPRPGDAVIGKVVDVGSSYWLVDLNSPYPAPLRVNEVPWRVDFGDTARYIDIEDTILAKVLDVDETRRVSLSMKDQTSRKLTDGQIVEISHAKVPRVIGKKGSMIDLIETYTKCKMFVAQNGRIWIDGEMEDMINAVAAVRMIEEQAQVMGLTEAVRSYLEGIYGKKE